MAFTRKALKAMSLSDEQIDNIIDMHAEVVDALKDELKTAKEDAGKLGEVQKELDALKAKDGDDYKTKYEKEHSDFEAYKQSVTAEKTASQKNTAVRAYFESNGIGGTNLDIAMRGAKEEIDGVELDGDKIKDTAKLDALLGGTYKGLISKTEQRGQSVSTPPAGNGSVKSREDIYKKDEHGRYVMDAGERQRALAALMEAEG